MTAYTKVRMGPTTTSVGRLGVALQATRPRRQKSRAWVVSAFKAGNSIVDVTAAAYGRRYNPLSWVAGPDGQVALRRIEQIIREGFIPERPRRARRVGAR